MSADMVNMMYDALPLRRKPRGVGATLKRAAARLDRRQGVVRLLGELASTPRMHVTRPSMTFVMEGDVPEMPVALHLYYADREAAYSPSEEIVDFLVEEAPLMYGIEDRL